MSHLAPPARRKLSAVVRSSSPGDVRPARSQRWPLRRYASLVTRVLLSPSLLARHSAVPMAASVLATARTTKSPKSRDGHLDAAAAPNYDTTGLRDRLTRWRTAQRLKSHMTPATPGSTRAARTTTPEVTTMRQGCVAGTPVGTTRTAVPRRRTSLGSPPRKQPQCCTAQSMMNWLVSREFSLGCVSLGNATGGRRRDVCRDGAGLARIMPGRIVAFGLDGEGKRSSVVRARQIGCCSPAAGRRRLGETL